jgi:bifunctional non-homologous end joining protein LigD
VSSHPVPLTNLAKLYWPADGITKGDLIGYDEQLAPVLLPYLVGRPVTVRVYPSGVEGPGYYRRDRPAKAPEWLRGVDYRLETTGAISCLLLVDDVAGLLWLANRGAIEWHPWTSRLPHLATPDQAIFDLDPGDQAGFTSVLQAARLLHQELERLGLRGYPKTSGGRGLHVYLPIAPSYRYEQVRGWVKNLGEKLAAANPSLIASAGGATHRGRRIAVDYAQNSIGRNAAAPYTVRARPGAPVSTPLTWDEVDDDALDPSDFTLATVPARVARLGDLFAPTLRADQKLPV